MDELQEEDYLYTEHFITNRMHSWHSHRSIQVMSVLPQASHYWYLSFNSLNAICVKDVTHVAAFKFRKRFYNSLHVTRTILIHFTGNEFLKFCFIAREIPTLSAVGVSLFRSQVFSHGLDLEIVIVRIV